MKTQKKPWGSEKIIFKKYGIQFKILRINKGEETSLQYHKHKTEAIVPLDNNAFIEYSSIVDFENKEKPRRVRLIKGVAYIINYMHVHRFVAGEENTQLAELSNGSDEDIIRLDDKYGRK